MSLARIKAGGFTGKVLRDLTLKELLEEWHAGMVQKRYRRPGEVAAYFGRMEPALLSAKLSDLQRLTIRHSLRRYAEQRGPVGANRPPVHSQDALHAMPATLRHRRSTACQRTL